MFPPSARSLARCPSGQQIGRELGQDFKQGLVGQVLLQQLCVDDLETARSNRQVSALAIDVDEFDIRGYDERGRLARAIEPDGSAIAYRYDAAGNRIEIATDAGATGYTYDALNRLQRVSHDGTAVVEYAYDDVGNLLSMQYANGDRTGFTYDSLDRLVASSARDATGGIILEQTYTLDPVGNRLRVVDNAATTVDFAYDALNRLLSEQTTTVAAQK